MNFQKLSLKVFTESAVPLLPFMDTFNECIQNKSIPGTLIDVADYTHMSQGPGVVLVSHEANWSMDEQNGKLGLLYTSKIESTEESLTQHMQTLFENVCKVCEILEATPRHKGLKFNTNHLQWLVNDRLTGKNTTENQSLFKTAIETWLKEAKLSLDIVFDKNQKNRLSATILKK